MTEQDLSDKSHKSDTRVGGLADGLVNITVGLEGEQIQSSAGHGKFFEDCASAFSNSLKTQANGVIQLMDKAGANVSEFDTQPISSDSSLFSGAWAAHLSGQIALTAVELGAMRFGIRSFGTLAGKSTVIPEVSVAVSKTLRETALVNGSAGALMGGILSPSNSKEDGFWTERFKNAATLGVSFAGMGLTSNALSRVAPFIEQPIVASAVKNGYVNNFVGGFIGGAGGAELSSMLNGDGALGAQAAAKRGFDFAIVGVAAHGVESGLGSIRGAVAGSPTVKETDPRFFEFSKFDKPSRAIRSALQIERENPSAWYEDVSAEKRFATLKENVDADVVVVGAGVAGLQAAHELAASGFKTVVLESNRVASAATSQMAAMVDRMPDWGYSALEKKFGETGYARLMQELDQAQQKTMQLARDSDADVKEVNTYKQGSGSSDKHLRKDVAAASKHDAKVAYLSGDEATQVYPGTKTAAVLYGEGQLHPRKFAMALASKGDFATYEDTPALGLSVGRADGSLLVHTPEGTVNARHVVFATGDAGPMFPDINNKLWAAQVFGTRAKFDDAVEHNMISSRDPIIDFWRQMGDKQVLFGGSARALFVQSPLEASTSLIKRLDKLLPGAKADKQWNGTIFINPKDGLPIVAQHQVYSNLYSITGLGGSGLVNSAMTAKMVRLEIQGKRDENILSDKRLRR